MSRKSAFTMGLLGSASALAMVLASLAVPACAADAAAAATADTANGAGATEVEAIVVTTNKRSETVQNLVGTVTGISAATLKAQGIQTLDDVSQHAPGMTFYTQSGTQFITLRGVGVPVDTGASDPNTAVNVDGVNLPRADEATGSPYDLERVEVASGPQGTLYGRNATGGAVNFILKKPTEHYYAEVGFGGGNYGTWDVHGMVSGPLTDNVRALLSAYGSGREIGFVKNLYNNTSFDKDRQWGVRGALEANLAPNLKLDVSVDHQYEQYDQYQQLMGGTITVPGGAGVGISAIPGLQYSLAPWTIYSAYAEPSDKETTHANVTINWDINPYLHLRSISGASIFRVHGSLDGLDVVPTNEILPGNRDHTPEGFARNQPSDYFSEELNLLGEFGHGGTWVLGGFVSDERYRVDIPIYLPGFGADYQVGNPNPANPLLGTDLGINFNAHYHESTQAIFGDATIPITSKLRIFGGLRYSHETNDEYYTTAVQIFTPTYPSNRFDVADGCAFLGQGSDSLQHNFSWDPLTARAGVQYDFTNHIKGYFQYSEGFKDGGTAATLCGNTYKPEYLTAYEVGVKSTLLDGRIIFNVSGYRYDYNGLQIYQGVGSAEAKVVNADAQIYGVDMELRALLTRDLSIDVVANYLDDYFTNFLSTDASDPNNIVGLPTVMVNGQAIPNLKGNSLPGVPDYNVTAGIQENIPVSFGGFDRLLMRLEGNFVGRLDIEEWNRPETIQHPFAKLNAVVQLSGHNGWTIRAYGRNLTNEATTYHFLWNGGANVFSGQYSPPRTFGIEFTKTFGG